ncbi:MAG: hypothetical protein ACPGXK_07885, partial [Phycisphaerae bacterium]
IPELNESVLEQLGAESADEFKGQVKDSLESRLDQSANDDMYEQIGDYLIGNTSFDLPEGMSNRQVQRSLERRRMKLVQQGLPPVEVEQHIDEIRDKAKDQVARDLKLHFILEKIAETENVEVKDEQFNAAIAQIAQRSNKRFDRVRDELYQSGGLTHLYLQLRDSQVLKNLLDDAQVTEVETPAE